MRPSQKRQPRRVEATATLLAEPISKRADIIVNNAFQRRAATFGTSDDGVLKTHRADAANSVAANFVVRATVMP